MNFRPHQLLLLLLLLLLLFLAVTPRGCAANSSVLARERATRRRTSGRTSPASGVQECLYGRRQLKVNVRAHFFSSVFCFPFNHTTIKYLPTFSFVCRKFFTRSLVGMHARSTSLLRSSSNGSSSSRSSNNNSSTSSYFSILDS